MTWYLVTDGGGIACADECETPREALDRYMEAIGADHLKFHEIWSGDSNTSDMQVCEVTEAEAQIADGHCDRWPDRELKTYYYREEEEEES